MPEEKQRIRRTAEQISADIDEQVENCARISIRWKNARRNPPRSSTTRSPM